MPHTLEHTHIHKYIYLYIIWQMHVFYHESVINVILEDISHWLKNENWSENINIKIWIYSFIYKHIKLI